MRARQLTRFAHPPLLAAFALFALTGCYQQVVGAKGLGASKYNVQESGRSNTAADRAFDSIFGGTPTTPARRWETPAETPRNVVPGPRSVTAGRVAPGK